jgi:hypothetical protein
MAIAYDFDGTLSSGNMQEYDFIPALKIKTSEFWKETKRIAKEHDADEILGSTSPEICSLILFLPFGGFSLRGGFAAIAFFCRFRTGFAPGGSTR